MKDVQIGVVKWFNDNRGWGFVEYNGDNYFVHYSSIICNGFKTLKEGAKVSFIPAKTDKGLAAKEVRSIDL